MFRYRICFLVLIACFSLGAKADFKVAVSDSYLNILPSMKSDLEQLYRLAGIEDVSIEVVPGPRVLVDGFKGFYDAIDARFLIAMEGSGMVPLMEPLYYPLNIVAFGDRANPISVTHIDELNQMSVVADRGLRWAQVLAERFPTIRLFDDIFTAVKFVEMGRADVYLSSNLVHNNLIGQHPDYDFSWIEPKSDILMSHELFHFVHEKHQHLVPELTRIVKKMRAEGRFKSE